MNDSDLAFATLPVLGAKLRSGEVSAVELREVLPRPAGEVRAEVQLRGHTHPRPRARSRPPQADAELKAGRDRGPLHGIPYGAKDLLATKGIPTTWGCAPYKDRVIDHDATVVRKLREAGAVLVAKLSMVELAGGMGYRQANASLTGPGRNPWKPSQWSGGSSSGSGSAVAAGLVPFAIGTETWGSITTPSSYCGLTGLRPTYGRVSRAGAMALSWTLDKIGPMAHYRARLRARPRRHRRPRPRRPLRHRPPLRVSPRRRARPPLQARRAQGRRQERPARGEGELRARARGLQDARHGRGDRASRPALRPGRLDDPLGRDGQRLRGDGRLRARSSSSPRPRTASAGSPTRPSWPPTTSAPSASAPSSAATLDAWLAPYDAVLTVPTADAAPDRRRPVRRHQHSNKSMGGPGNVCGTPAIVLPTGLTKDGLPTALQLDGRAYSENRLIALAVAFQNATAWHDEHPEVK